MRTKNMDFGYPPGMFFPKKYDHIRPQGRPHEKEFKLLSNHKNKCHKLELERKMRIWSLVSMRL